MSKFVSKGGFYDDDPNSRLEAVDILARFYFDYQEIFSRETRNFDDVDKELIAFNFSVILSDIIDILSELLVDYDKNDIQNMSIHFRKLTEISCLLNNDSMRFGFVSTDLIVRKIKETAKELVELMETSLFVISDDFDFSKAKKMISEKLGFFDFVYPDNEGENMDFAIPNVVMV